jgi:peptide/nickel transport system substrate-binding protein
MRHRESGPWWSGGRGLLLLACLTVLGCRAARPDGENTAGPAGGRSGGRVVIGVRGDITSFNIYTATNAFSQEVADLLFMKLATEQDDFGQGPPSFRPALASSWEYSAEGTRLTFHLDERARWSDGRPVGAADVVFSHQAATSPAVAWVGRDVKEPIAGVSAPDERTVVYQLRRRHPTGLMDAVEGNIIPEHVYAPVPLAEWPRRSFLEVLVANGPFRLARYERGAIIELVRNPGYLRAPLPRLDSVVFRIIPDEATLLNELLTGGIDVMENIPERAAGRVAEDGRLRVLRAPDLSYTFICWNIARPLFSDTRVRRALTMAIDREAIIAGLLPGTGRPSAGPILSSMWAHDPELRPLAFDPEGARRLLEQAGWLDRDGDGILDRGGTPFRFELETNQGSGLRADVAQMVGAQLRRIGVEASPRTIEFGAFIEKHETHDFDAFVGTWRESTKVDLKSAFHSASAKDGYNYGLYAVPELDALIDQARSETDTGKARVLWRRAQQIIARDQPYTFLFERDRLHAVPRALRLARPSPRSLYAALEEWDWEPVSGEGS